MSGFRTRSGRRAGLPAALPTVLLAHRRWLAAGLTGLAVWSGMQALAPGPGPTVPVLTARHDLAWGAVIGRDDVAVVAFPAGRVPGAALHDPAAAIGRLPATAVRRGEPITDVRLLGTPASTGESGTGAVAAPVRIADASAARMLQPGMVIDVLAAPSDGFAGTTTSAMLVAAGVRVLSVAAADELSGTGGALVVLATNDATAARLAAAESAGRLSVTWRL